MENLPNRHRNHQIESLSERYFNKLVPINWVVNRLQLDYGIDLNCEIAIGSNVTGMNFSVQLKGKEKEIDKENVKIVLKRSTINRWLNRLEPIMVIAYIVDEDEAYWLWFEDNTVDLTLKNDAFTINIPRKNKLSQVDWNDYVKYVETIFNKRSLLYSFPKITSLNKEAWKLYFENKHEKALVIFYDLITENPNDALLLEIIAICEFQLFNYQKALIYINKALDIDNNVSFRLNKASILSEQGFANNDELKINQAILIYKSIINENYVSDTVFYNLGNALSRLGKYQEGIEYYLKALKINPNKPNIWNNLGNSYMNLNLHKLEMECYDKALTINPNLPETLFSKGSSMFKFFGETSESLRLMLKSAELTDRYQYDNPYFFFWISEIYLTKNDCINATKWNTSGLNFFPTDKFLITQRENIKNSC